MAALTCDVCGGKLTMDASREFSKCEYCGLEYTVDTMRSMIEALAGAELNVKGIASSDSVVKRAHLLCEDGDFAGAEELVKQALAADPENPDLYLVALMAEKRCRLENDLGKVVLGDISESRNYMNAIRFGDSDIEQRLGEYVSSAKDRYSRMESLLTDSWFIAAEENSKEMVLLVARNIVAQMPYHQSADGITWEQCTLRSWLNNDFYDSLPPTFKNRVWEVVNHNPDNPIQGTNGGNPTTDRVFLLSLDEVNRYLTNASDRIAKYQGSDYWWWLRSPGLNAYRAAYVYGGGGVDAGGSLVDNVGGGVRPALWLRL